MDEGFSPFRNLRTANRLSYLGSLLMITSLEKKVFHEHEGDYYSIVKELC